MKSLLTIVLLLTVAASTWLLLDIFEALSKAAL